MDYQLEYVELKSKLKTSKYNLKEKELYRKHLMRNPVVNNSRVIVLDGDISILESQIEECEDRIKRIEDLLQDMTKELDSLELQVFYYKFVKMYSLKRISKKLNYSYSHIKRISSSLSQKVRVVKSER